MCWRGSGRSHRCASSLVCLNNTDRERSAAAWADVQRIPAQLFCCSSRARMMRSLDAGRVASRTAAASESSHSLSSNPRTSAPTHPLALSSLIDVLRRRVQRNYLVVRPRVPVPALLQRVRLRRVRQQRLHADDRGHSGNENAGHARTRHGGDAARASSAANQRPTIS